MALFRTFFRISLLVLLCWQAILFSGGAWWFDIHGCAYAADRPVIRHVNGKAQRHQQAPPKGATHPVRQRTANSHTRQVVQRRQAGSGGNRVSHAPKTGANRISMRRRHVQANHAGSLSGATKQGKRRSHTDDTSTTIQYHTDTLSDATTYIVNDVQDDSDVHHATDMTVTESISLPDEHTTSTSLDEEFVPLLPEEHHLPLHEKSIILVVNPGNVSLDAAMEQGLHTSTTINLTHLGISIVSLVVPDGGDTSMALQNFLVTGVSQASLNTYYHLDEEAVAENASQPTAPQFPFSWFKPCRSGGKGIRIGMVDSRVDQYQQELSQQQVSCKCFFSEKKDVAQTDHGTAIAKLLVGFQQGSFTGLVPGATLFVAEAFPEKSHESQGATVLTILKALDWLVSQHVQIINLSFSGPDNALLAMAMEKIQELGINIVAAAGNHGPQAPPAYPGAYKGVIAVTAVDQFKRPYRNANRGAYIGFAAPGVRVPVPGSDGNLLYKTGTSFATPYATALLAILLARWGKDTPIPKMLTLLKKSAEDLGKPGKDPVFGWGLLRCNTDCSGRVDT